MTPTDWTPIVEAASRAHVESAREGTWAEMDTLTRYNVGQALLPAIRAAVEVALKQQEEGL